MGLFLGLGGALAGCAGGLKQGPPSVMAQTAPPTIDQSRVGPDQGASIVGETTQYEVKNAAPAVATSTRSSPALPRSPPTVIGPAVEVIVTVCADASVDVVGHDAQAASG